MSSLYGNAGMRGSTGASNQSLRGATGSIQGSRTGEKIPSGYKKGSMANFTPEMMQLFQQMFGELGPDSYLARLAGGDQDLFAEMEAPALKQFSGIQGNLASRFSGMGIGGRRSSGFQNTSNQAASDFAQQLQSRRQELQRGAIGDLWGMKNDLLGKQPYDNFLIPKGPSGWQQFLGGSLPIAGAALGGIFGGPAGAGIGGRAGSAAAQAFY